MKTRKKILLSDDANDFRAGCQERLRERGYDVILRKRTGLMSCPQSRPNSRTWW